MSLIEAVPASDGSCKYLWGLPDSRRSVESVAFSLGGRPYICISTQVGCAVGCVFCETGRQESLGNLHADEIYGQVAGAGTGPFKRVVVAGMGEPLLNLDHVIGASRRLLADGLTDEVSITTSGLPAAMRRLDEAPLAVLSVSLHATTDSVRSRLIPTNRKYGLQTIVDEAAGYRRRTGVPVIMNYLLFDGINDSEEDSERLVALLDPGLFTVKLKYWNDVEVTGLRASPAERFEHFCAKLVKAGFDAVIDHSAGADVAAGCGQLRSQVRELRPAMARV